MFDTIRADYQRYRDAHADTAGWLGAVSAFLEYGFLATIIYRYGRWTRLVRPSILAWPLKLLYLALRTFGDLFLGINISTNADIGPGLYIGHYGGIFLHGDMGRNCSVGQGVTIGYKGAGKSTRVPQLGDNVYVGTSAVIIGDIRVGHGAVIGANTTVVKDVPDGYRVVSAPSRILPPADHYEAPARSSSDPRMPATDYPAFAETEPSPMPLASEEVDTQAAAMVRAPGR